MASKVSANVIKRAIENSTKAEAQKIVDKHINEILPKIKDELTDVVVKNLFSIAQGETDEYKPELTIVFETVTKKGGKSAGTN